MTETKQATGGGIYAAIAAAIGDVRQIGKDGKNNFDKYDFVSIDKFLTLVNPICARHGLFPWVNTESVELYDNTNSKGGKSVWARFHFHVSMMHSSGESIGPATMMVSVPMNGAQSSGSAQSYALKQFFRGMFMIPTGDKDDADLSGTEKHEAVENRQQVHRERPQRQRSEADSVQLAVEVLDGAISLDDLKAKWAMLPKHTQKDKRVFDAGKRRKTQLAAQGAPEPLDALIQY